MNKSVYDTPDQTSASKRHILTVLVDNEPGVLARVIGMFSGRGYNIESLNVAEVSLNEHLSRITIVTVGNREIIDQIRSQLMRIVPVHTVKDLTEEGGSVEAEVALISIDQDSNEKKEIFRICDIYRARKIENENSSLVFEIAGTSERIDSFIKDITKICEIEIVRSGPVALSTKKTEEETS